MMIRTHAEKSTAIFLGIFKPFIPVLVVLILVVWVAFNNTDSSGTASMSSISAGATSPPQMPSGDQVPIKAFEWHALIFAWAILSALTFWVCLLLPGFSESDRDKTKAIILRNNEKESLPKYCFDIIAGRHQIFKNTLRGWIPLQAVFVSNLLLIGIVVVFLVLSALVVAVLGVDYHKLLLELQTRLSGNIATVIVSLPVSIISMHLYMFDRLNKDYAKKWTFCATAYEKYIEKRDPHHRIYVATLILQLDLWSKRTFAPFFWETLERAIIQSTTTKGSEKRNLLNRMKKGDLTEGEVETLFMEQMASTNEFKKSA